MKQTTVKRWKFIRKGFKSEKGKCKWEMGKWQKTIKDLELCKRGYHCSKGIYQAFSYVQGEILCQVECKGKHISSDDKEVWENQRVIRAWKWTKKDSVALAIFSAELCLSNFEKAYPDNKWPREAIETAKRWLRNSTRKNREAARSAAWSAAWSARSARSARSAAESAAESAAWSAAWSAAESAEAAARSAARSAAWSAWSAVDKIAKWMDSRLSLLEEIE